MPEPGVTLVVLPLNLISSATVRFLAALFHSVTRMMILYHFPIEPLSRKIRIVLGELNLPVEYRVEEVWKSRDAFLHLNPAGTVPVLLDIDGTVVVAGAQPIAEYLNETRAEESLIPGDPPGRAEVRRLCDWFDGKFNREVTECLLGEKFFKRLRRQGGPDGAAIRAGRSNLDMHLSYIGYLADRRRWLAGDNFSLADISAAAQLSCVDYLGDIDWGNYIEAKQWYVKIKSRPSFRPLLEDRFAGMPPASHYADVDF